MEEKMRVIIVDDDDRMTRMFQIILTDAGIFVDCARNGTEALEKIESGSYDLAIIDVIMPGIDGIETLAKLREFNRDISVVMMTEYSVMDKLEKANRYDVYKILNKPINTYEILSIIDAVADKKVKT